jgi:hypothetical protein
MMNKKPYEYDLDAIKKHAEDHVSFLTKIRLIDQKIRRLDGEKERLLEELKKGIGQVLIKKEK